MSARIKNDKGFTLIEVIAVLIIIAIVTAVVISRGVSSADVNLKSAAETLKGHIRYTQIRAMNMKPVIITCYAAFGISATSNTYFMFRDCNTGNKVAMPGASDDTISLPGMTLTATNAPNNFIK